MKAPPTAQPRLRAEIVDFEDDTPERWTRPTKEPVAPRRSGEAIPPRRCPIPSNGWLSKYTETVERERLALGEAMRIREGERLRENAEKKAGKA